MRRLFFGRSAWCAGAIALGSVFVEGAAIAQSPAPVVLSGNPKRDALARMMKPVDIEFRENRLEDVVRVLTDLTGADFEPMWIDDRNANGLDKETLITLRARGASALKLMERVLEKAQTDETGSGGNSWQLTDEGAIQIGPKSRLNRERRVEIYDINDLLLVTPDYDNAPEFDLQSTLQNNAQGGGGGQSPFRQTQTGQDDDSEPREQRAQRIVDLILELVEPEQWSNNGGDGGSVRYYQGGIIVNAPDYIHRQLNGYPFWPTSATRVSAAGGRRYVTLDATVEGSTIDGFTEQPVTGVVGGTPGGGG